MGPVIPLQMNGLPPAAGTIASPLCCSAVYNTLSASRPRRRAVQLPYHHGAVERKNNKCITATASTCVVRRRSVCKTPVGFGLLRA